MLKICNIISDLNLEFQEEHSHFQKKWVNTSIDLENKRTQRYS